MPEERPACYTVVEAARRLARDPKTVRAWMANGRLTAVADDDERNPTGEVLLLAEDVDAAADRAVVLLRPAPPAAADPFPAPSDQDWYRRENQQLSTRVEVLERDLAATRAELTAERRRRRRLLEAMADDLADDDTAADAR
jgi:hypothetical protein